MPLEILRTIIYKYSYTVVKLLYKYSHLSTGEIESRAQLSRKQVYTAIKNLKSVNAITKYRNEYVLTQITKEILKYLNVIEEIEASKLNYKVKEIIEKDKKLSQEDVQKILKALKLS